MIDTKEHWYNDDPAHGHPDCRTRLKDAFYYFIGNGLIQAGIQIAPSNEGSGFGLLILDPETLSKKREVLSFDPKSGLEQTMLEVICEGQSQSKAGKDLESEWVNESEIPMVEVKWKTSRFEVVENIYCPDNKLPVLVRRVKLTGCSDPKSEIILRTGIKGKKCEARIDLNLNKEQEVFFLYSLDIEKKQVSLDCIQEMHLDPDTIDYWNNKASASFGSSLLDHYFRSANWQLPAVISCKGKADASIWQYNREWVRDHSMMAVGLVLTGHQNLANIVLGRLLEEFVSPDGDPIDSSEKRHPDEIELDQNGELLWVLQQYVNWTNDLNLISKYWEKVVALAEFPLKEVFRHSPSGLVKTCREYWERHGFHGIKPGMELAHQIYVSVGLDAAASLALKMGKKRLATRWNNEARRLEQAMLHDRKYGMVSDGIIIKRRNPDGTIQNNIQALPEAGLPEGVPLFREKEHFLHPDTSQVFPIILHRVSADSTLAHKTLESCEDLWNQAWDIGGYGRYHFSSEADSAGPWPFPSLFMARAWLEAERPDKVLRILEWLSSVPGGKSGAWFEFYGDRIAPPYPQVGITPWTWAEMLLLFIHHLAGFQPEAEFIRIRPSFLPGVQEYELTLFIRSQRISLKIRKSLEENEGRFLTDGKILESSDKEICIEYPKKDIYIDALLP